MAIALVYHCVILQYKKGQFPEKSGFTGDGVIMSVEHVWKKGEIPVRGCVDFCIRNVGTAKAFLFDGAVVINPGESWFPTKSTPLPLINQPVLTFEGDYQLSRALADLNAPVNNQ